MKYKKVWPVTTPSFHST